MWKLIDPDTNEVITTFPFMPNLTAIREFIPMAQSMGNYIGDGGVDSYTVKYAQSTVAWVVKHVG